MTQKPLKTGIRYKNLMSYFFLFISNLVRISSAREEGNYVYQEAINQFRLEGQVPLSSDSKNLGNLMSNRILHRYGRHYGIRRFHRWGHNHRRHRRPFHLPPQSSCPPGSYAFNGICVKNCQKGHYIYLGNCVKCSKGCSICTSFQNCIRCSKDYKLDTVSKYCRNTPRGCTFILLVFSFFIYILYACILVATISVIILSKPRIRVRSYTPEELAEFQRINNRQFHQSNEVKVIPELVELNIRKYQDNSKMPSLPSSDDTNRTDDTIIEKKMPRAYGIGERSNS